MPLTRLIASPKPLLVFEAVARLGSFTGAAREFNISQPSISRNVAHLEQELGVPLFVRGAKGARLTPEGRLLHQAVRDGLSQIADAIEALRARHDKARSEVVLSLSNAFVTNWMGPRLAEFAAAFPDVALRFELVAGTRTSLPPDVDLATRIVAADSEEVRTCEGWDFVPEIIAPVCSPAYRARHGALPPDRIGGGGHTFLHLSDHDMSIWAPFLGPQGAGRKPPGNWLVFSDYAAILQAALDGTGIALGWLSVVSSAVLNGRMVQLWDAPWQRTGREIRLFTTRPGPVRPVVVEIANWLRTTLAEEMAQLPGGGVGQNRG